MTAPIADGVMAATHKFVQQAMTGQWQEVPKTIQERRDLLARISSTARPQDQQFADQRSFRRTVSPLYPRCLDSSLYFTLLVTQPRRKSAT